MERRSPSGMTTRKAKASGLSGMGGEDGGAALAEADAGMADSFAKAAEDDLIAVLEEGAGFAGGKKDRASAVAGKFEEAASGGLGGAGDGPGGQDVANLKVAAVAGVVGD